MDSAATPQVPPLVGILVLNYHHPRETLDCVRSLLAKEGDGSRILWIENDSAVTAGQAEAVLESSGLAWTHLDPERDPLPPTGVVGFLANAENLGYAGGNNVGLRYLRARGVPYAWILNNDTLLLSGSSRDLVACAARLPRVGALGTSLQTGPRTELGHELDLRNFAARPCDPPADLSGPTAYIAGSSLFVRLEAAALAGFLPESYFLYYEDAAFCRELRRAGWDLGIVPEVVVRHLESLASGRRSPAVEYYTRRNRLVFMQNYFPDRLRRRRTQLLYSLQKYLFRGEWTRLRMEWVAHRDFRKGVLGKQEGRF